MQRRSSKAPQQFRTLAKPPSSLPDRNMGQSGTNLQHGTNMLRPIVSPTSTRAPMPPASYFQCHGGSWPVWVMPKLGAAC